MNTAKLLPARTLQLGYFIQEQMDYRNWNENVLSEKSGIESFELNLLLENKMILTPKTAKALASVFGSSFQYWMKLDSNSNHNIQMND